MGKFYIGHLAYKGTQYYGWQKQADVPTIQETIFNTLRGLYEFGRIEVKATSRTDRDVHALAQVVKFLIPRREDPEDVRLKVNEALPDDIYFTQLERINKSFKVTYLALYKEYLYFFSPHRLPYDFVGTIDSEINIEAMKEAARYFVGVHDFRHFQNRAQVGGDFKRKILEAKIVMASEILPQAFKDDEEVYCFYVKGEGFLKQMVRLMMGTLIHIGLDKLNEGQLVDALGGGDLAQKPGFIAPGAGLFLKHIEFPEVYSGDQLRRVVDQEKYKGLFPHFWNGPKPQSFEIT